MTSILSSMVAPELSLSRFWQATVPPVATNGPVFRWNSKFDQNSQCPGLKFSLPTTTKFCARHDSITISLGYAEYVTNKSIKWNFEFDRNIVSGTCAWHHDSSRFSAKACLALHYTCISYFNNRCQWLKLKNIFNLIWKYFYSCWFYFPNRFTSNS